MLRTVVLGSIKLGDVLGFTNFEIRTSRAWVRIFPGRAAGGGGGTYTNRLKEDREMKKNEIKKGRADTG